MGFDFQKKVVTVTLQTVTKLFNIGGLKIVWTVHAPSILPISCRRDLSFDFAQDGELVEPPVAMLSQAGACSYRRGAELAPYLIRG